jgi:hypothetical protein
VSQINDVLDRIAHIQVLIEVTGAPRPNVLSAEPYLPSDVASNYCPFFINEIHGGPSDIPISAGQQYLTDDVWMVLCVRRFEATTNLKLGEQEKLLWRDAVYAAFAQRVKLSDPANDNVLGQSHVGLSYVLDAHIKSWEPIKYIYGVTPFLALKYILAVNYFYVTTIAA